MTVYTGLIVLQPKLFIDTSPNLSSTALVAIKWLIPLVVLLIVPGVLTYVFINWHFVQGNVRDSIHTLQEELGFPDRYLQDTKYEGFTNKSWLERFCIGKGHIVFIALLWLLVIVNWVIFCIFSKGIVQG